MVRPHGSNLHAPALFRVINVPVARHHQEGSSKPNPTILKKLGGYHRRVAASSGEKKRKTLVSFFRNTIRKIKNVFRMPPSPLIRRIQELEDDIQLLRQKNEILEKGYTFGAVADDISERSSINAKSAQDRARSQESEATATTEGPKAYSISEIELQERRQPVPIDKQQPDQDPVSVPAAPPAPPINVQNTTTLSVPVAPPVPDPIQQTLAIPVPPPAPPVGVHIVSRHPQAPRAADATEPAVLSRAVSADAGEPSAKGINLDDILNIKLKPVEPKLKTVQTSSFHVTTEELFSVPLKPVSRRGHPPARTTPESGNDDFRILRAAMKRRIQALYSPSASSAASDPNWSVSPHCRSKQARSDALVES